MLGAAVKGDVSGGAEKFTGRSGVPHPTAGGHRPGGNRTVPHHRAPAGDPTGAHGGPAFFGLVVGSIIVTAQRLKLDAPPGAATLVGVAVVAFVVLFGPLRPVEDPSLPFVFVAGAIAICAMIPLPGVSVVPVADAGPVADSVLGAVSDRDLAIIAVFGLGAVLGLAGFSTLLHWALHHHHQLVLSGLVGLMLGPASGVRAVAERTEGTEMAMPAGDVGADSVGCVAGAGGGRRGDGSPRRRGTPGRQDRGRGGGRGPHRLSHEPGAHVHKPARSPPVPEPPEAGSPQVHKPARASTLEPAR
ncbi:MAG: DUF368 domain-containing protein [Microthrixaceae bacterium]